MSGGATPVYLRSAPIRRLRHPLDESPAWSVIGGCLWAVLALALALPLLVLLAVALPTTFLLRWLLLMCHWNRHRSANPPPNSCVTGGGLESMSGNESRWLGGAWQCSVVHAVLVFEAPLEVAALRQLLLSRVLPIYPRLTRRPVALPLIAGAGYCWMPDSNFSIDNHVFPAPNMPSAQPQIQEYVSQLVCKGLTWDKPPWELHVLSDCAVLRVHQAVADGTALVKLLCHCLADTKIISTNVNRRKPFSFYCDVLRACLLGPLSFLFWLLMTSPDCNLFTQSAKACTGGVKVTWSAAISFAKVTRVKQVTRSTVNCVLLSALSGALRSLLQSCGVRQPPDLKVLLPVDVRRRRRCTQTSSKQRLGTKMAPVVMSLPVGVEGAVPRLWHTRKTLHTLKQSTDPVVVYVATAALMSLLPAHFARHLLANIGHQKASVQFSSQIGPTSSVLLGGCALKSVYALLPAQSSLNVSVSVFTYGDQLFVTVATNHALGPTGNLLLQHLHSQIELLYNLLKNRRVPGEMKSDPNLYRFPDVTRSPVREIAYRLNYVQEEVQRLSRYEVNESEKLQRLKAEFSHLLRELRKRKANNSPEQDIELWDHQFRSSRRRSVSCSFTRRSSNTLLSILATNRPVSYIETTTTNTVGSGGSTPSPPTSSSVTSPSSSSSGYQYQQQRWIVRRNTTGFTDEAISVRPTKHRAPPLACTRRVSSPVFGNTDRLEEIRECQSSHSYSLLRQSPAAPSLCRANKLRRGVAVGPAPLNKSYSQPASINDTPYYCRCCIDSHHVSSPFQGTLYNYRSQPIMPTSTSDKSSHYHASDWCSNRTFCLKQLDMKTPQHHEYITSKRINNATKQSLLGKYETGPGQSQNTWRNECKCHCDIDRCTSQQQLLERQFDTGCCNFQTSDSDCCGSLNHRERGGQDEYSKYNYNYVNQGYRNDASDNCCKGEGNTASSMGLYDEILYEMKNKTKRPLLANMHVVCEEERSFGDHTTSLIDNESYKSTSSSADSVSSAILGNENVAHSTRYIQHQKTSNVPKMIQYYREPCCTKESSDMRRLNHVDQRLSEQKRVVDKSERQHGSQLPYNTAIKSLSNFANKVHVLGSLETTQCDCTPTSFEDQSQHHRNASQSNISSTIALTEPPKFQMASCSNRGNNTKRDITTTSKTSNISNMFNPSVGYVSDKLQPKNNSRSHVSSSQARVGNSIESYNTSFADLSMVPSTSYGCRGRTPVIRSADEYHHTERVCIHCDDMQLTSMLALSDQSPDSLSRKCGCSDYQPSRVVTSPMSSMSSSSISSCTSSSNQYQHHQKALVDSTHCVKQHKMMSCDNNTFNDMSHTQSESFFDHSFSSKKDINKTKLPHRSTNNSSISAYDKTTFI